MDPADKARLFARALELSKTSNESLVIMDLLHAGRELGLPVEADFEAPLTKEYYQYRKEVERVR